MSELTLKDLEECREQIDMIDVRLLQLLNERTSVVERIGAIKRLLKLSIYEPKREDQVLANVLEHNTGPLSDEGARRIFERIMDEMRTLQKMKMVEAQSKDQDHSPDG